MGQLEKERKNWEGVWDEIVEFVIPRRTQVERDAARGKRNDQSIFDGTALDSLKLLADGLQGYLISSSYKWFAMKMEDQRIEEVPAVRSWLQEVERLLYGIINRSNFYRQMHEMFMDAGSFGTAAIYSELDPGRGRVNFSTRHPKEIYLVQDNYGHITEVWRYYFMTIKQIVETFENVDEHYTRLLEKTPDERYPVIHCVYPREGRDVTKKDSQNKAYASQYIDVTHKKVFRSSGYDQLPYAVWRFYKNSDEVYGRSPAWNALADVKSINEVAKTNVWAAQMSVRPPLWVPEELKGRVRFVPGGMNYYSDDPKRAIAPVMTGVNYPIGVDREDRMREAINKHFMVDFFLLIARAEKEMTATEIREKQEEKSVVLGPTVNGLEQECLDPVIDRGFYLALEQGWLPPPPEFLAGAQMKIDYMGPLAQAQRRFFRSQPYRNTLQEMMPVLQVRPEVADIINWDEVAKDIMEANDMPQSAFMKPEMIRAIRQQRAQQMQQQQQLEAMEKMGKALPGIADPNVIEQIEKAAPAV